MYKCNTNKLIKLILICAIIVILIVMFLDGSNNEKNTRSVKIGEEYINVFETEDASYLFLPSFVGEDDIDWNNINNKNDIVQMSSSNIPSMFIRTRSGDINLLYSGETKQEIGTVVTYNADGREDYSGSIKIRGRGNYSWNNWDKKSITVDISNKVSLLGEAAGDNYALIANASDATLIRNEIARRMEEAIDLDYAMTGKFLDLYIDGDYMGVYYLCPTVSVSADRVNIANLEEEMDRVYYKSDYTRFEVYETPDMKGWNLPEEIEDYTGGYILEREFLERYELEYADMGSGIQTDLGECFVVKSPKYCSKQQINYLYNFLNETETAINSFDKINHQTNKRIDDYIDIESFAKWYLINEITKNYDAGISSTYIYKDSDNSDGRLKMATGWDYDMSMGNYLDWMIYNSQDANGITRLRATSESCNWFSRLYEYDEFYNIVAELYNEKMIDCLNELIDKKIDNYKQLLKSSSNMDAIRWNDMYINEKYVVGSDLAYDELKEYLEVRKEYLQKQWCE